MVNNSYFIFSPKSTLLLFESSAKIQIWSQGFSRCESLKNNEFRYKTQYLHIHIQGH